MTKYYKLKLVDNIKEDAKKIKKLNKNIKCEKLSYFQNELSKILGYRHFHELISLNSKKFQSGKDIKNISGLIELEYLKLKNHYHLKIKELSNNKTYQSVLFNNVKPLNIYTINPNEKLLFTYNFTKGYFFDLSNKEFELYMKITLKNELLNITNKQDIFFCDYIINFNKVMFKLADYLNIKNYQIWYRDSMNLKSFMALIINNPNFSCPELKSFFYSNDYKMYLTPTNDEINSHKYITMFLIEIVYGIFIHKSSSKQKSISLNNLENGRHDFLWFDEKNNSFEDLFNTINYVLKNKTKAI